MRDNAMTLIFSPELRRFARFLVVGVLNTAFGYLVFAAIILAGFSPQLALLVATIVGIAFNFMTTGRLVFASRDNKRLPRFVLVYCVSYGLNALALRGLIDAGIPSLYAQVILLPAVVVVTFAGMRIFVFQENSR
jgi:putative flippase GtrA